MLRRLIVWLALILASVVVAVQLAGTQIAGAPGPASQRADARTSSGSVASFVRVETSTPVVDVLYRWGEVDAAPSGAYGPNVTAPRSAWFLEYQRAGAVDVVAGVVRHDPGLVQKGLELFHFGLARQAPNGSFPGSAWPFHGTALFLSEAAPSLVVLRSSDLRGQFAGELAWQVARMRRAAHYMVRAVGGSGKIDDSTKNHRFYEAAVALGTVGVLSNDSPLRRWSTRYARRGIAMERPDGVMPEDGGHDSGYQALGMVDAARYLTLVARGRLYASLYAALQRGEDWELSRIGPDGSVDQAGDTRTAGCKERDPTGNCKTVFYAPIFNALAHWAAIGGGSRFALAAHRVWLKSGYGGH